MGRISKKSNTPSAIRYNPDTYILEIEFHNHDIYQYFGVPEYIYQEFTRAPSAMEFYMLYIKNAGYVSGRR